MATPIRPLQAFFPLVRPYAPMAADPFIEQALRLAAITFCEKTRCWRYQTTRAITVNEAQIVTPPYAAIFEIETAAFNGHELVPTQYTDLDLGTAIPTGQPYYITQATPGSVIVFPFQPGTLALNVFLKPRALTDQPVASSYDPDTDDDYNVVPEFLLVQHGEAIANGALARILMMPGQPFSDPATAQAYAQAFAVACDSHFNHAIRGEHRAAARSRPRFF